LRPRLHY